MTGSVPSLLQLEKVDATTYLVPQPSESAEGRDVVFSGQLIAQMIMAADDRTEGAKDVKSVQAVFCRAGSYASPIELVATFSQDSMARRIEGDLDPQRAL